MVGAVFPSRANGAGLESVSREWTWGVIEQGTATTCAVTRVRGRVFGRVCELMSGPDEGATTLGCSYTRKEKKRDESSDMAFWSNLVERSIRRPSRLGTIG